MSLGGFGCYGGANVGFGPDRNKVPTQGQIDPTNPRFIVKFRQETPFDGGEPVPVPGGSLFTPPVSTVGPAGLSREAFLQSESNRESKVEQIFNNIYLIKSETAEEAQSAIANILTSNQVEYVESDVRVHTFHRPNDPEYTNQWAHTIVQSERAWDIGRGSSDVIVAEIDTGIDYTHPDLAPNMWTDTDGSHGYNFVSNNNNPMADDRVFHGTHVAGIIGAVGDNRVGIAGSSHAVRLMALKFLRQDGFGDVSDAIRAIGFAISKGARIINNSWGGGAPSRPLYEAIDAARGQGILFVAAAGNGDANGVGQNNDQLPTYPANYALDNVLAVAATDSSDRLTSFSNYGATTVHVAAPGGQIYSTMNGSRYQFLSGTSMATPLVSGLAAAMLAVKPGLSYQQLKSMLISSSDPVSALQGRVVANGRVNAYKAMLAASGGTPDPSPTPTPSASPTPWPSPTPTPTQPAGGIARPLLLNGLTQWVTNNPYQQIALSYDVSEFPGTYGGYVEVSQANVPFGNPNGNAPDPRRLRFAFVPGLVSQIVLLPVRDLPGWGTYSLRVIPLSYQNQPTGLFSTATQIVLRP